MIEQIAKNIKRILGTIIGLVLTFLLVSAVQQKKNELAGDIQVEILVKESEGNQFSGKTFLVPEEVEAIVKENYVGGTLAVPVNELDVKMIEEDLNADPFIEHADVFLDVQNKLHVRVSERKPILRVLDAAGGNYYMDAEGIKVPISSNFAARVPVATGNIPAFIEGGENNGLKGIKDLAEFIYQDEFLSAFIEQIHVEENGDYILAPKIGKQKIIFGTPTDIPAKFRKMRIFYKEGLSREGWRKYETINLKYDGQVTCARY